MTKAGESREGLGKRAVRMLYPFVRPHWRGFVPALLAVVAGTLLGLLKPWPLAFLIDDVLGVGQTGGAEPDFSAGLIAAIAGAVIAIAVLSGLFSYIKEYYLSATSFRVAFSLRRALFGHIQRLSLAFHDRQRTGDLITRVTNDVTKVQELVTDKLLVDGLSSVLQFGGMLGIMLWIDWRLALVAVVWCPLVPITSAYYRRRIRNEEERVRTKEGDMTSLTQETISSIRVVKAFGGERSALSASRSRRAR